ncbi:hypothetical protein JOC25_000414 [Solibacillus kalamii]|uniref:Uncharacterized protein n=1 Tax=Solibacillus kalamii TaxID=1748298 RepID=A0ABX3ZIS8_9BACL|nr:hypothetical protein [Solibacillus kalamii]MBM7663958.1 hypothetical protein [Solibacillus kalamii]OUZ39585.1 hypothetical protein CBM15_07975 [Solibacillus kalamii]
MEKRNNRRPKKSKKEKLIWALIILVIVIVGYGYMSSILKQKYSETALIDSIEIAASDYKKDKYSKGTITYNSEDITENKKIILSEENIAKLLTQFEKTTVTGIKRKDIDALNLKNSYTIEFDSNYGDDLVLFVGRDEISQNVILDFMAFEKKLADKYLVQDEETFYLIEELVKQAP